MASRQIKVPASIYKEAWALKKYYADKKGLTLTMWRAVSAVENSKRKDRDDRGLF